MTGVSRRTLLVTVGLLAAAVMAAPVGHAQTTTSTTSTTNPYPGACTTTVSAAAFGSASIGSTITLQLQPTCAWTPNSTVEVVVNGQSVGTKTANANGFVQVVITVLSATTLSVDDPVLVPNVCGTNTVVGRGTSTVAGGNVVTHQATFTVVCPATPTTPGRIAFTGANFTRWLATALAAVMLGAVLVVGSRQRRRSPSGV
ncbi:MAG: hypothetical protein ACRD12_05180 [Acidimicrobiales bacterium]